MVLNSMSACAFCRSPIEGARAIGAMIAQNQTSGAQIVACGAAPCREKLIEVKRTYRGMSYQESEGDVAVWEQRPPQRPERTWRDHPYANIRHRIMIDDLNEDVSQLKTPVPAEELAEDEGFEEDYREPYDRLRYVIRSAAAEVGYTPHIVAVYIQKSVRDPNQRLFQIWHEDLESEDMEAYYERVEERLTQWNETSRLRLASLVNSTAEQIENMRTNIILDTGARLDMQEQGRLFVLYLRNLMPRSIETYDDIGIPFNQEWAIDILDTVYAYVNIFAYGAFQKLLATDTYIFDHEPMLPVEFGFDSLGETDAMMWLGTVRRGQQLVALAANRDMHRWRAISLVTMAYAKMLGQSRYLPLKFHWGPSDQRRWELFSETKQFEESPLKAAQFIASIETHSDKIFQHLIKDPRFGTRPISMVPVLYERDPYLPGHGSLLWHGTGHQPLLDGTKQFPKDNSFFSTDADMSLYYTTWRDRVGDMTCYRLKQALPFPMVNIKYMSQTVYNMEGASDTTTISTHTLLRPAWTKLFGYKTSFFTSAAEVVHKIWQTGMIVHMQQQQGSAVFRGDCGHGLEIILSKPAQFLERVTNHLYTGVLAAQPDLHGKARLHIAQYIFKRHIAKELTFRDNIDDVYEPKRDNPYGSEFAHGTEAYSELAPSNIVTWGALCDNSVPYVFVVPRYKIVRDPATRELRTIKWDCNFLSGLRNRDAIVSLHPRDRLVHVYDSKDLNALFGKEAIEFFLARRDEGPPGLNELVAKNIMNNTAGDHLFTERDYAYAARIVCAEGVVSAVRHSTTGMFGTTF